MFRGSKNKPKSIPQSEPQRNHSHQSDEVSSPQYQNILTLQRTIGNQATRRVLQAGRETRVQRKPSDDLRKNSQIIYGKTPLTQAQAHQIILLIEAQNDEELAHYLSAEKIDLECQGKEFSLKADASHEWGLGRDRNDGEVFIIAGDKTEVVWTDIKDSVEPIAHSHPYFESGKPRVPFNGSQTKISTVTKEIADHPDLPQGFVEWQQITKPKQQRDPDASVEMAKIFPSASDIQFCADEKVASHVVYTTYTVGYDDKKRLIVGNPANRFTKHTLPFNINTFSLLSFIIQDAKPLPQTETGEVMWPLPDLFSATLIAKMGTEEIWRKTVTTRGANLFPMPLNW